MQIVLHKSADARVRARTNVDNKRNLYLWHAAHVCRQAREDKCG